jgi:hypothetical protein
LFIVPSARALTFTLLLLSAFMALGTVISPTAAEQLVHGEANKKLGTRLTLQASTTTPTFGDSITLFGSINITTQALIFLLIQSEVDTSNQSLTTHNGSFSFVWSPTAVNTYNITAVWKGDSTHNAASSSLEITVAKQGTTIALFPTRANTTEGNPVTFAGTISPAISGALVTVVITSPNFTRSIQTLQTYANGSFRFSMTPLRTGTWAVAASWLGDGTHLGSESASSIVTSDPLVPAAPVGLNPSLFVALVTIPLSLAIAFFVYKYAGIPIGLPLGQILKRRAPPHLRPLRVLNGAICPMCFRPMLYEPKGADWHCENCGVYYESQ